MKKHDWNCFGDYINTMRKKYDITLEQLCEGLCTPSQLAKLEKGERKPGKLLQGRLLARLGIIPSDFENLMDKEEYDRWRDRQRILHEIRLQNWDAVQRLLAGYREKHEAGQGADKGMEKRLERQFYLAMLAQYRWNTGERDGLAGLYQEAVELTIPKLEPKELPQKTLSVQELNLILEYYHHRGKEGTGELCERILQCMESPRFDQKSRARIYPKAVFYLWEYRKQQEKDGETGHLPGWYRHLLELCDRGIEILRDDMSLYYMWELLGMREEILTRWCGGGASDVGYNGEEDETAIWFAERKEEQRERSEWKKTIEACYTEYGIPIRIYEFCYLYEDRGGYCIGDVIRIRREMLGMTPSQLCENICSMKTLRRIERHVTKPQRPIAKALLARLGLPMEYCRTELATGDPEIKRMMRELRKRTKEGRCEEVDQLLEKMEKKLSMDIPFNRQVLTRYHALNEREKGAITMEEYISRMTAALELTLPLEAALSDGEKYMTDEEIQCVHNMVQHQDTEDVLTERCVRMLMRYFRWLEDGEEAMIWYYTYEIVMTQIASYLGNKGMYDESSAISRGIIKENLLCHRMNLNCNNIYNILWNCRQCVQENIPFYEKRDEFSDLRNCIMWSLLIKNKRRAGFYERKIKDYETR